MKTYQNNSLLDTLAQKRPTHTPVWLMRQAGRYLPEYRKLREQAGSFLTLAQTPELAAEATLQPVRRFGMDAAILFSDILTIPDALGMQLTFEAGKGPHFRRPEVFAHGRLALTPVDIRQALHYVADTIRLVANDTFPIIGFSGSPFTLACYMVDGGAAKGFVRTRRLLYSEPGLLHALLELLTSLIIDYLTMQVEAGVAVLQIFDSWGGLLSTPDYETYDLAYTRRILSALRKQPSTAETPIIVFTRNATLHWYRLLHEAGATAIGIDWRHPISEVAHHLPDGVVLQGNLDPAALLGTPEQLRRTTADLLESVPPTTPHIFNLGHGIDQSTDPEMVRLLVDQVHNHQLT